MHHAVRQVEEEGLVLVFLNELHAAGGVVRGEVGLVLRGDVVIHDTVVFDHRQLGESLFGLRMEGPHVIRVRDAVVLVKTVLRWEKLGQGTQVPFAHGGGSVALLFHQFGQRHFIGADAGLGARPEGAVDAHAVRVAARQQGGA